MISRRAFIGAVAGGLAAAPVDALAQQAKKVPRIVNMKTAKTIGLTVPPALLGRADQVIQ